MKDEGDSNLREYLIWSNQHSSWWGPNHSGYTNVQEFAGRYTLEEAKKIVKNSTCDGLLKKRRYSLLTGESKSTYDEVIVKVVEFDPTGE